MKKSAFVLGICCLFSLPLFAQENVRKLMRREQYVAAQLDTTIFEDKVEIYTILNPSGFCVYVVGPPAHEPLKCTQ